MITKLANGSVLTCGFVGSIDELKTVGEKQTAFVRCAIHAGKKDDESDIWVNVVGWGRNAYVLQEAKKGDQLFVIGRHEVRESNGRKYNNLNAEFISVSKSPAEYDRAKRSIDVEANRTIGGVSRDRDDFAVIDDLEDIPF